MQAVEELFSGQLELVFKEKYDNSSIYLDRKFKLYSFFKNGCRSLEEFNELLLTNIGESCDANPEIND